MSASPTRRSVVLPFNALTTSGLGGGGPASARELPFRRELSSVPV
jgi:hypothetical protein